MRRRRLRSWISFVIAGMLRRCVLLFQRKADDYVEVKLELYELDVTSVESKANYAETKY